MRDERGLADGEPVSRFRNYGYSYHKACNYLVAFGGYGPDPAGCRHDIAAALVQQRAAWGGERARATRRGMLFIAGHFPDKMVSHAR